METVFLSANVSSAKTNILLDSEITAKVKLFLFGHAKRHRTIYSAAFDSFHRPLSMQ